MFSQIKRNLISYKRITKQIIAASVDFISFVIVSFSALYISNKNLYDLKAEELLNFILVPFFSVLVFSFIGVYRSVVRYIDFSVIYLLIKAILLTFFLNFFVNVLFILLSLLPSLSIASVLFISLEGWLVGLLVAFVLIIGSRVFAHYLFSDNRSKKRVVIYGAGSAGIQLAGALKVSHEMDPVAFLDSNPSLHNTFLGGVKVLNPTKLRKLVLRNKVDEVLIAMPSASKSSLRSLLREIEDYSIKVRILPGLAELAQGKVLVSELKEVDVSNLLGRLEVDANQGLINRNIAQKVVLITGAGGSIGSEISRQVARKASKVILLDANEYALYSIKNEIENLLPETELHAVLGSVTNKRRITEICKAFAVDTVYHAAAYKHVSLVEENPFEGVFNNIIGTQACVQAAIDTEVETFVLISTDKAVRPTNIMGATKRFAEMILQSLSDNDDIKNKTRITMVRFGNVIGSSGSAIPLFQQQIKEGGPVTVTHSEVIRYFMSIPEAAELVIQAGAMGKGGDVFVLDMGEPIKIHDLAKRLISLSGMELKDKDNPEGDIEIIFTGLRPGEKLYEELLIGDNVSTTEHKRILRAEEDFMTSEELEQFLSLLKKAEKEGDVVALKEILREAVSGFTPENEIVDVLSLQKKN
ncbi:polysaccharide biosynthesis protein [Gammaproteobacteria bacterium]|nr:polysaccharide biosynthesis protein [Gammaproteobacteria bacterium]